LCEKNNRAKRNDDDNNNREYFSHNLSPYTKEPHHQDEALYLGCLIKGYFGYIDFILTQSLYR